MKGNRPGGSGSTRATTTLTSKDPDGNIIELLYHPLGVEDSAGKRVELVHDPDSLTWSKRPDYDDTK